ncbi:MAG: aldo/keto reductase [Methanobacteriaceae archaeon]
MYRKMEKTGDELSLLGYGCMRFPRRGGMIDEKRARKQVISAIENGVNYFDTAYIYPGSEKVLGNILKDGYRERVKIATKMPILSIKKSQDLNEIFEKQLERLQTDYIDYYLFHNLSTYAEWEFLKSVCVLDFIKTEKEKGRIINIGFSFHGNIVSFKEIIDSYDWDFCMIQYNFIDEGYQAGTKGLEYAASRGIGIIAMEPLRGGMLANKLPKEANELINNFTPKITAAEWAFRWLGDNPNINVVLSGMNREEDIEENINIFSNCSPNSLSDDEKNMLGAVKEIIHRKIKVNCTSCGYCLPCPKNVNIPKCFSAYNDKMIFDSLIGKIQGTMMYLFEDLNHNSGARNCTKCGVCEKKCPQDIAIMDELENVDKELDKWYFRAIAKVAIKVMYR